MYEIIFLWGWRILVLIKFNQLWKKSEFGLVINWDFHERNRWVSALTPYLVNALIEEFHPIIISSQLEYELHKRKIKYIISMEPGWAAPKLKYDAKCECIKAIFYSDPHYETKKRLGYFNNNGFDYVFSYYKSPFFYHFVDFPEDKFVHMPWAIPDQFIADNEIVCNDGKIAIFGGANSDAYDMRNWCRKQNGVIDYANSGVENKVFTDEEYFLWLSKFEAIIAAGSTNPIYDLVTPKYFEIMASGALLIGQKCKDLKDLRFTSRNMVSFENKEEFLERVYQYQKEPEKFNIIRKNGRETIRKYHLVSNRIQQIKQIFMGR